MSRPVAAGVLSLLAGLVAGGLGAAQPLSYFTPVPDHPAAVWEPGSMLVETVEGGSVAEAAGLRVGDRLIGCAGFRVRNAGEARMCMSTVPVGGTMTVAVVRAGAIRPVTIAGMDHGHLGITLLNAVPPVDAVALTSLGIPPGEYLGTKQGGRTDGGVLDALLTGYAPTNNHRAHPVLAQLRTFPARATEAIHRLGPSPDASTRAWVLGLLKAYYALIESRGVDARRHLGECRRLNVHVDPFLEGLAAFYERLASAPPGAQGADAGAYGVTPEFFALCFPPPVLPIKLHDWTPISPQFAADLARACSGESWDPAARDLAARRYAAPPDAPDAERYTRYIFSAMVDCAGHGGWPIRFDAMRDPETRAALLAELKQNFATNVRERVLCALALVSPSAVEGDLGTYRAAMTVLRDAGSRELAEANFITRCTWDYHWSRSRVAVYAIHREINDSLGIDPFYRWLADHDPTHADRFAWGWYVLDGGGLTDGTDRLRSLATVHALGGPAELTPQEADDP